MTPSRFCLTSFAAAVAIVGAVAAFNYAVDPYLLFNGARIAGFNDLKPAGETRERMMKAYQVERLNPRTIVIGSSRTDLGIDPTAPSWPASAQPVYNLSLDGGNVLEGLKYLRHYVAMQPGHAPKTVVVGLDFESFLYTPGRGAAVAGPAASMSELDERLAVDADGKPNPQRSARVLKDRALGLLSLDAIIDSVKTIDVNRSSNMPGLEKSGHMSEAVMREAAHADGFAMLFHQKNLNVIQNYAKPHRVLSDTPNGPIRGFDVLKDLLGFAKAHDIDVVLTIQPAHVSRLELLDRMGYWNDYERWKRELVALTAQARTGQQVTLWDFGGYQQQVQEAVPVKGSGGRDMQWFWDPVHYNSKFGDRLVAEIFHTGQSGGLGVVLTPENVEAQIAKVRSDRDAFRAAEPQETARLARLVSNAYPEPALANSVALAH